MAADDAERTEEPTPKRIEDARKRGEVANSRDVSSLVVLAAALFALTAFPVERLGRMLAAQCQAAWSGAVVRPDNLADYHALLLQYLTAAAPAFLGIALALFTAGAAVSLAQTGPLFSAQALAFRGSRLDPIQGLKRMVNADRLFDLAKAPLKVGVVFTALVLVMRPAMDGVMALAAAPPGPTLEAIEALSARVASAALGGLAVLAVADFVWQQHRYRKRLRMSLREVRDELREREGNPQVRSRRKTLQRELSRQRMIADVAKADVVIANPTHYAVALRYVREEMGAPKVLARGRDHLALRIRAAAREHDVPVVENPPLARLLYGATRVGREVPEHLFEAVAEVLAYVYRLDQRRGTAWGAAE